MQRPNDRVCMRRVQEPTSSRSKVPSGAKHANKVMGEPRSNTWRAGVRQSEQELMEASEEERVAEAHSDRMGLKP